MLVVFGGLPGTGKTTVARRVAGRQGAVYLRIDAIEQAVRRAGVLAGGVGPAGYAVANALAAENLGLGRNVVADGVNPVAASREGWRRTAAEAGVRLVEVELVCSDPVEHRRRVETRVADVSGLMLPTWEAVQARVYEAWATVDAVIDTAGISPDAVVAAVLAAMPLASDAYEVALPGVCVVSDERTRLDMEFVQATLAGVYWARDRPPALTERSWGNCLCFGVYGADGVQIGFARLLTDYALRAHLGDVFIAPGWRGGGLGAGLVQAVLRHPALASVTKWTLVTADAHALYARFGFRPGTADGTWMTLERTPPGA